MKNIITALAIAAFGATTAFAQEAVTQAAPERDFVIGAKFDFESAYVTEGKRHVNENTQTTISFKYFVPQTSDIGWTPYVDFAWVSPTDNQRLGKDISDEGSIKIGSEVSLGETYGIDFGYKYTGWNDRASAWGMNRAYLNRTNEIFFGINKTISLIDGNDDANVKGVAYVHYDFNREQLTYELGLEKAFSFDEVGLRIAATYGYVDSNKANGDQRSGTGLDDKGNDYGFVAVSVDLSYQINSGTDIGLGVRYAYNNDGDDGHASDDNDGSTVWWGAWINFRY